MSSFPLLEKLRKAVEAYPDSFSDIELPKVEAYERNITTTTWSQFNDRADKFRLSEGDLEKATGFMSGFTHEIKASLEPLLNERRRIWVECDYAQMRRHLGYLHVAPKGQCDYSDKKNYWGYQFIKPTKPENMPVNVAVAITVKDPQVAEFRIIHDGGERQVTVTPYSAAFNASRHQPFLVVGCEVGELIMNNRLGSKKKRDVIEVAMATLQKDMVYMTAMLESLPPR